MKLKKVTTVSKEEKEKMVHDMNQALLKEKEKEKLEQNHSNTDLSGSRANYENSNNIMEQITDLEAKELGVKKEVFQRWSDLMQGLWTASISFYKASGSNDFLPANKENQIFVGSRFKIDAVMINNKYVEARLFEGERQLVEILFESISVTTVAVCFFKIIKELEG